MSRPPLRALVAIGVAVVVILSVALVPITIVAPGGAELRSGWDRLPLSVASRIVVEQDGSGSSVMSLPRLEFPEFFQPESSVVDPGPFEILDDDLTMQAESPGELVIEGVFGDAAIDVLLMTHPVAITVTRSAGAATNEDTFGSGDPDTGASDLESPAVDEAQVHKSPYLFRVPNVGVGDEVYVGERLLNEGASAGALLATASRTAGRAWLLVLAAWSLISVCSIAGGVILRLFGVDRPPPSVPAGLGFGMLAIVANTLAYFLDMRAVIVVVLIAIGVLALVGHRRHALRGAIRTWSSRLRTNLVVIPLAVVAFFPLLAWGPWFAGNFKTDLFEYATLSSLLQDHSLFDLRTLPEAQASGNIASGAGFLWRSIDSVVASFVSNLGGLTTIAGFTIVGLALMLLFGIGVADLGQHLGRARFVVVGLALLNPLFTSLYLENYFSQYFLVALIPGFIVTFGFLANANRGRPMTGVSLALSAQAAAMIAVYPYFFAVIGAAAILAILSFREYRAAIRAALVPVVAMTAVLVNFAWITVIRFGETNVFEEGLNAITRNVLLSGLGRSGVAEVLLGLRSYHWRNPSISLDGLSALGTGAARWARLAVVPDAWWIALGLAAIVGLLLVTDFHRTFVSVTARVTLAVFSAWVAFAGIYLFLGGAYVSLKAVWTAGALVPLVLATAHWRRRWQPAALGFVGVLAILWSTTVVADRINWILPNPGSEVRASHIASVPDLVAVDKQLATATGSASVVRGKQPLEGSDLDRVLTTHAAILIRDHDLSCTNCSGFEPPANVDCSAATQGLILVVGLSEEPLICDLPLDESGPFVEIRGIPRGG